MTLSSTLIVDCLQTVGIVCIYQNPSPRTECETTSIFKLSLTGLNSEFSFSEASCHTKVKEPSLPYYLSIAGERIVGCILYVKVLVLCEMPIALCNILTLGRAVK